jgi:hypothetical protein
MGGVCVIVEGVFLFLPLAETIIGKINKIKK